MINFGVLMEYSKIKLTTIAILLFFVGCETPEPTDSKLSSDQQNDINNLLFRGRVPGIQVAYFDESGIYEYTAGYKNWADSTRLNSEDALVANDLGQIVIMAICFRLQEEGELDLNESIATYYVDQRIVDETFAHLINFNHALSHTAGLPIWAEENERFSIPSVPGENWSYSKVGYQLIVNALEKKYGTTLQELAKKWVFDPLDMVHSSFEESTEPLVSGHDLVGRDESPLSGEPVSFRTSAADFQKLLAGLINGSFLDQDSRDKIQVVWANADQWGESENGNIIGWGPGMGITVKEQQLSLWHYSDDISYQSFATISPNAGSGFVFLANSANGYSIATQLLSLFTNQESEALNWLDYVPFDNVDRQIRIDLERSFAFQDSSIAVRQYEQLFAENPEVLTDNLINNIVWSFFEQNDLDKAEAFIRTHLSKFPESSPAWIRLGETLGFKSEYQKSWQSYQKAMELDPNSSQTIMPRFPWYMEATNALQEEQNLGLEVFAGKFEDSEVILENDQLLFSDDQYTRIPLKRLGNTLFDLETVETYRLQFIIEHRQVTGLERSFLNGDRKQELIQ